MSRRPIAFNNSSKSANSIKKNKIEIGLASDNYSSNPGGLTWFNGADSTNQYVIYSDTFSLGMSTLANSKPVCWASGDMSDASILRTINGLPTRYNQAPFTTIDSALAWVAASSVFNGVSGVLDNIVTDNLVFNLDCSQKSSYPGSGSTWYDLSGNGVNGTLTNGPTYNSANGGSIVFDGTNDYTQFSSLPQGFQAGMTNYSISIWFKLNATIEAPLLEMGTTSNDFQRIMFWLTSGNPNRLYALGAGSNSQYRFSSVYLSQNTIYNAVYTYNHTGTVSKLYINNVEDTGLTNSTSNGLLTSIANSFSIGGDNVYTHSYFQSANIYNVLLYTKTLSPTEIAQNYNAQKSKFGL